MGQPTANDANAPADPPATPRRRTRAIPGVPLLLAGGLLLLVGIFALGARRDHAAALESGWQMAERGALGAAEHARRTLSVAQLVTLAIAQQVRRDGFARFQGAGWNDLSALAERTPEVTALWVTDATGRLVLGSTAATPPAADWSTRPFFAPLRDGAAQMLMPLTFGVITRNWYLGYSTAIRDGSGRFLGVAQSALFTDDFSRAYAELRLPAESRAGVFRAADGAPMILWPPPPPADGPVAAPRPAESAIVARLAAAGEAAGRMEYTSDDGPMLVAWRRFQESEPLVAVVAMRRDAALAPFHARLWRDGAILFASVLPLLILGVLTLRAQRRAVLSEARFRGTFEQAAVGVAHFDVDGRWIRTNERFCTLLGYSGTALRRSGIVDVTHPDDRAATEAAMARLVAGKVESFSLRQRCLRRDGSVLWVELTASVLRDETTGRVLHGVAIVQDIGAAKAAEAALAASEERLALASAAAGMGVYDVDMRTGDAVVTDQYRRVFGLPPGSDVVPRAVRHGLVHPDDRDAVQSARAAAQTGQGDFSAEFRILRADTGELRWLATRGSFVGGPGERHRFVGVTYDITDQLAARVARAESERRLALACAAMGLGVFDVDVETGMATVNAEWRQLYGVEPSDAPVSLEERLAAAHPDDRAQVQAATLHAYATGTGYDEEFRILRRDTGEVRWMHSRGAFIESGPKPRRFLGLIHDITERRREQDREMLLAREVDHRARNVLAVVRSIVKLSRADDPRQFADAVEGRVSALARAHTLLARDRWTGAELAEVAREELAAYGDGRSTFDGPKLRLRPDAVQPLSMVLHELATNAAKYGALSIPAGRIALSWRLVREGGEERVALAWQESGGPAPPEPPVRRGFGSIVVEATVRSQLGGEVTYDWARTGLRCTIALPTARALAALSGEGSAPAVPPPATREIAGAPAPRGRRVLLVEDEPLLALELSTMLSDAGWEVIGPAATLDAALALAESQPALDAAVLDANLHGRSSRPVATLLAARGVPVIHVTGYSSLPQGPGAGERLLSKPLRDGDLLAALADVLGGVSPAAPARPETASAGSPN